MQEASISEILEFRCLGTFAFSSCDGWREGPSRTRGRALLQYLVSHARSAIPRSALIEALWPDCELADCAHRLHLAVSGARLALRDEKHRLNPIVHRDDSYGWHSSIRVVADTDRFVSCYNTRTMESMAEGVEIYAGPFLAGEPGDWLLPLRTRYEHMYVTMLERLALTAAQCDDYAGATGYALRAVAVDPAHEGAVRIAMLCLAKSGRRAAALAEYENLNRYLKRWLGVGPMPDTTALHDSIRSGQLP
ncbi:MAG TPA: bacterial transcriptional activator domain-containing protein [Candidatus Acidoferrales bacterium]|jgi:two-component SAPR family response regulator|nr:bacterial transcriptional activator domain-containing protein [Candidatus Acidoferrales bacterium]